MGTVPTGRMELELKKLYLQWLRDLPAEGNMEQQVDTFHKKSQALIERMGGQAASLGALPGFPTPKLLDLSPHIGTIYSDMKQAAIKSSIAAGLNATDVARHMLRHGMDTSYHRLNRLARSETVRAYWKNTWDSADGLGLVMVWSSEQSARTCDYCISRDGLVVADTSIRDHPNGRCTLVPTHPSQVKYRGTLQPDGSIDQDPAWDKDAARTQATQAMEHSDPLDTDPQQLEPVPPTNPRVIKTLKDMDDFGAGMIDPTSAGPAAKTLVEDYIAGTAYQTNAVLRGQKTSLGRKIDPRTLAYVKKTTKAADDLFDKSLIPEDVRVVRALQMGAFGGEDSLKDLAGTIFQDKGYMSTSLTEKVSKSVYSVADAVEMEITVPKGTRAVYLAGNSYLRSERELLLDRGTRLAIESTEYDPRRKTWKVKATVVPGPR